MRVLFLASTMIATALLSSTINAASPRASTAAPDSFICNYAIYDPEECRPPWLMKFDFKNVMSLGTRVTPGDKGCRSPKDNKYRNDAYLDAPMVCDGRWLKEDGLNVVYEASEDGVIGMISVSYSKIDDALFMQLRAGLEAKFGPPTLVMRPLRNGNQRMALY